MARGKHQHTCDDKADNGFRDETMRAEKIQTANSLTSNSGIRHIAFRYGSYAIDFIYSGNYSNDKTCCRIDLNRVRCIITNRISLPNILYDVGKDAFIIDASQAIDSHMFNDNEIDRFIRQIETCRDIVGFVRQIARDYFMDYADRTSSSDAQDKAEAQFHELLSSGQLYRLAGLPDLPASGKEKTEQAKEDRS